jgi:hypothetical protein
MPNRVRRLIVFATLILGMAAAAPSANATPTLHADSVKGTASRAMWLWSRADPAAVVDWAQRHQVKEIFAYVGADIATNGDRPRLKRLKTLGDAAGIKLAALGGEPGWATNPSAARTWLTATAATGLFYAHHVDVEPYALNSWTTDRDGTAAAFVNMLGMLQAADSRPLEADIPFWYNEISLPGGTNLADATLARVNAVTVMSYRDTATGPNSITDVGADMLARATAAGKDVRLGAETQELADCLHCTFFEEGQVYMQSTLTQVDAVAQAYGRYKGIAVHHFDSWVALRP